MNAAETVDERAADATATPPSDGEKFTYVYNPWGQLVEIKKIGGGSVTNAKYTYSAMGHRISEQLDTNDSSNSGVGDGLVDAYDPKFFIATDPSGRRLATYRGTDSDPKETFIHHDARIRGPVHQGGPILRDRNTDLADKPFYWASEPAASDRYERHYYALDYRGYVSAIFASDGTLVEQVRYSATGIPFNITLGDVDGNGKVESTGMGNPDYDQIEYMWKTPAYHVRGDLNLDGDVDAADLAIAQARDGTSSGYGSSILGVYGVTTAHQRLAIQHQAVGQVASRNSPPTTPPPPPPPLSGTDESCAAYVPFSYYRDFWEPRRAEIDSNQWANFHFWFAFKTGQGRPVNLEDVGLLDDYLAHPAIARRNATIRSDVADYGLVLADASMASLRCQNGRISDTRFSSGSIDTFVTRAEITAGLGERLATDVSAINTFLFSDWTFSLGGHKITTQYTCLATSKCVCSYCKIAAWSCIGTSEMSDRYTDLASIYHLFGRDSRLANVILIYLEGVAPATGPGRANPFAGTPYTIMGKWDFALVGEIVECE